MLSQVHLLEFNEEDFEITSQIYRHPQGEIWSITSSPVKPDHFFTVYNIGSKKDFFFFLKSSRQINEEKKQLMIMELKLKLHYGKWVLILVKEINLDYPYNKL